MPISIQYINSLASNMLESSGIPENPRNLSIVIANIKGLNLSGNLEEDLSTLYTHAPNVITVHDHSTDNPNRSFDIY